MSLNIELAILFKNIASDGCAILKVKVKSDFL